MTVLDNDCIITSPASIDIALSRDKAASDSADFSIHLVTCASCGSSFDVTHQKHCQFCGSPIFIKAKEKRRTK